MLKPWSRLVIVVVPLDARKVFPSRGVVDKLLARGTHHHRNRFGLAGESGIESQARFPAGRVTW